jgi:hypothetical protein
LHGRMKSCSFQIIMNPDLLIEKKILSSNDRNETKIWFANLLHRQRHMVGEGQIWARMDTASANITFTDGNWKQFYKGGTERNVAIKTEHILFFFVFLTKIPPDTCSSCLVATSTLQSYLHWDVLGLSSSVT